MGKPTLYTDWTVSGGASKRTEPASGLKGTGWAYQDYVAGDHLNWILWIYDQWLKWFDRATVGFVTVGTGTDDDYATIALAVAASKNKIILSSDISVTAEQDFSLSDGVINFNGFKIIGTAAIAGAVFLISGDDNRVSDCFVECTHTSGTTTDGLSVSGNRNQLTKVKSEMNGAGGTVTDAIDVSGDYNQIDAITQDPAGTMSNTLTDTGTDNDYRLIEA